MLLLEGYARDKMTDKDIAEKKIGIAERTFTDWKARYSAIAAALKKGRAPIAEKIENSLYDLCDVQTYTDEITEIYKDADGNIISSHIRRIKREVPPNVTAVIFALKNLKAGKWRDKQEVKNDIKLEAEAPKLYEALKNPAADLIAVEVDETEDGDEE